MTLSKSLPCRTLLVFVLLIAWQAGGSADSTNPQLISKEYLVGVWSLEGPPPCRHGNIIRFEPDGALVHDSTESNAEL